MAISAPFGYLLYYARLEKEVNMHTESLDKQILFSCQNLCFAYEDEARILDGLNFTIAQGEKIVLLGRNGSGKSTLFKLMTTVLRPEAGELFWNGTPYSRKRKFLQELFRQIGLVFQDPDDQLFAATVEQEVSFGAVNLGLPEAEIRSRVKEAMQVTDTLKLKDKALEELSFGERKRVSIADLLVMDSRLLLLDEPTAWLDNENSREITKVLNSLNERGIALLCSTHNVDWAWEFADRFLVLNSGKLCFDGAPEDFFQRSDLREKLGLKLPDILQFHRILKEEIPNYQADSLPRNFSELRNNLPLNAPM